MGELHGEWKEIPCAEVANLVSKEPRALVKDTGFRIEGSVRKREEGCEAVKIRRGIANVVNAMPVGTEGTESV